MDDRTAREISALVGNHAWDFLKAEVEKAEENYWKGIAARVKAGEIVDQREIDFMRGQFNGARLVLRQPEKAVRVLARGKEGTDE